MIILSDKGWIALDRQLEDHWLWSEKPFSKGQAWIDLLLIVNHADRKIPIGNDIMTIKRGSKPIGLKQLATKWGWSVHKVSDFLNVLEKERMIDQKRNGKGTVLTIVKYDDFQDVRNAKGTQKENERKSKGTQKEPNNNDNHYNNVNKKDIAPLADENPIDYSNIERKWD